MAFVNEYISDNDVKKFQLDELWLKYHPAYKSVPDYYRYRWTIDRERDTYFMIMGSGREELSNRATCVLCIKGNLYEIELDIARGTSLSYSDQPYKLIWEMASFWPSEHKIEQRAEIINLLKDALTAYGAEGVRRQVADTIVEFKNF